MKTQQRQKLIFNKTVITNFCYPPFDSSKTETSPTNNTVTQATVGVTF